MKSRALFVDDEPLVLSGLRRMLRSLRHDWDMSFASSGQEALELLEQGDFAVIVSDMRMPKMDGAALLNEVAIRHPAVARLVLSGHAELDAIMRAVRPAHQFLAKPCDPKLLEAALKRIRQVGLDHRQDAVLKQLGAHRRLPSPSTAIDALREALRQTPADLGKASAIVGGDIAMSIQLLRLVNSAFFGPPTRTLDPHRAVSILGADILIGLVDRIELFRPVDSSIGQGEAAVVRINDEAAKAAASTGAGTDIDVKTRAMMRSAGPLTLLETSSPSGGHGEALGSLLLAYWGFDVGMDDRCTPLADPPRQAELQDA